MIYGVIPLGKRSSRCGIEQFVHYDIVALKLLTKKDAKSTMDLVDTLSSRIRFEDQEQEKEAKT